MVDMSVAAAKRIAGSLGKPSKMPGASYGLPIAACNVGAKLRALGATTNDAGYVNPCGDCYAAKNQYHRFRKTVIPAQERRLASITHPQWVDAMCVLIVDACRKLDCDYFRWHDAGDIQSYDHLSRIAEVARRLPDIKFWCPTREARLVKQWLAENDCPANLALRISAMATPSARSLAERKLYSTVTTSATAPAGAKRCPASEPQNPSECGDCRACWDSDVQWIDYHAH